MQHDNGYFADWHQVLKRVHCGDIIGYFEGRYYSIAVGPAFLCLVVSGFALYGQLLRQRARATTFHAPARARGIAKWRDR